MSERMSGGRPAGNTTVESARAYEEKRFGRRARMKRLNAREREFAAHVLQLAGPRPRVIDIPCGSGRFFDIFSVASEYVMADLSADMLQVVRERFELPAHVRLLESNVTKIPLPDGSADLCFCMRLFHHFPSDEMRLAALRELSRLSRSYVALSFYNDECLRYRWRKILGKRIRGNYISFEHLAGLAKQAGLDVCERVPARNILEQQCLVVFKKS